MSAGNTITVDFHSQVNHSSAILSPIISSAAKGWNNIGVGYYRLPANETPEISLLQHVIAVHYV